MLDLFGEQVDATPERTAVRYRDVTMTFADLDAAANTVAHQLVAHGVPRQALVPLLITDGPEFPVGLFGILKTGAAFVPLDPGWPTERLAAIAAELDPPAALTAAGNDLPAASGFAGRVVSVDLTAPGRPERSHPERVPLPSELIYGYYTSGSTGAPKCALNHHRGLVNRLTAMSRRFGDGAGHVALQNSRSTFDSAMWQVLWPLTSGGQVVLPDRDGILDLERTATTIGRYGVTITDFVPSVLAAFVSLLELRDDLRETVSCLRRMLIGGEAANPAVVHRLRELLPGLAVTNTYGPTECSIGSVFHDITAADDTRIPLGRPIDNTAAIVLDEHRQPVPAGTVGEIHLGGECIGAGYLHDPERTAAAFVPNPFPDVAGELLYRTGDLATTDPQGLLHFVGRRDDQVKIGGVRVELGDIDTALATHPQVGNAVALVLGDGDTRTLVCCVSPRSAEAPPSAPELRRYATERLPAELVPHRVILLDELPVNANGKADRKALRARLNEASEAPATETGTDHTAPATDMESAVAAAWCDVLGLRQVSVTVPFADYGGTSLAGFRLTVALSAAIGRTVRPRDLLAATTVREQAAALTSGGRRQAVELAHLASDADWRPPQLTSRRPDRLLVTGASGFVGAHLLAELLCHSGSSLTCLIRAADPATGVKRLRTTLNQYGLAAAGRQFSSGVATGRVEVLAGDLGRPYLGLTPERFTQLATTISGVVHAGAMVNFVAGYLDHRPANVHGTQELIRLASTGRDCRLHVLSTLSIFPLSGATGRITEDQLPAPDQVPPDGYSRSKHVAERLLATAREHGIRSVVYRLGEVWPHREYGVANPASLAHNVLYACVRTGCVFSTGASVDITPVDVVSRLIARAATGEADVPDGVLHAVWPTTLRFADAFAELARRQSLDQVSYAEFRRRLDVLAEPPDPDERLVRLRILLPPAGPAETRSGAAETRPGAAEAGSTVTGASHGTAAPAEFDSLFSPASHVDTARFVRHAPALAAPTDDAVTSLDSYLHQLTAPFGATDPP
ncbi:MAG: amino acid adenylation domain-containing protein, partial [Micromonosporaceae bacterium]